MRYITTQTIRFAGIGALNTTVDIVSYAVLIGIGAPLLLAVILSSFLGLACSYTMNRRYTFGVNEMITVRSILYFIAITGFGLWILPPLIIYGLIHIFFVQDILWLIVFKIIATLMTMIWNFCWYKWRIFSQPVN